MKKIGVAETKMQYEEFLEMPTTFLDDMTKVIIIKNKYRLDFTEEEKEINQHLMTYWEEMKINELKGRFERCWELDETE
jgi:hypothetical protein